MSEPAVPVTTFAVGTVAYMGAEAVEILAIDTRGRPTAFVRYADDVGGSYGAFTCPIEDLRSSRRSSIEDELEARQADLRGATVHLAHAEEEVVAAKRRIELVQDDIARLEAILAKETNGR